MNSATFSPDGVYRYTLERTNLGGGYPLAPVNFIMLNPSTADAMRDDPTVRRCMGFARRWGYDELVVTNLFALRSTDPRALRRHPEPIGPDNDEILRAVAERAEMVICAWGVWGRERGTAVTAMLSGLRLHALGFTKDGTPRHPLYLPETAVPLALSAV